MDDAVDILEGELGGRVPDGLTILSDEQLLALADLLQEARERGQAGAPGRRARSR